MAGKGKTDVRNNLAEIFLKSIEEDPLTWHKNFKPAQRPINGIYKNEYKGYNRFLLSFIMKQNGYQDPRFYPQSYIFGSPENRGKSWDDPTKIKVIKGEHPVFIDTGFFIPKNRQEKDADGNPLKPISIPEYRELPGSEQEKYRPVQKAIPVYNAEQLLGIDPWKGKEKDSFEIEILHKDILEIINKAADEMGVEVKEGDYDPCYIPLLDKIQMPERNRFSSEYAFAATLLHEMAHASGAEHRLDRDLSGAFGSAEYAEEELRAEIASAFMANEFGLDMPDELLNDHKAYVQSWSQMIKNDRDVLISAIFDAEKISDYIEDKAQIEKWIDYKRHKYRIIDFDKENIDDILLEELTDQDFKEWIEEEVQPEFQTKGLTDSFGRSEQKELSCDRDLKM